MMLTLIRNRHAHHAAAGLRAMAFVLVTAAGIFGSAAAAVAYEVVTVSNGGTIEGSVTLTGKPPAGATLKVTKNQDYCGANIADPTYTVGSGGGLANVIVYLKDITKGKAGSATPLSLGNEKCMFSPRVQGAMVGESLKISSADTVLHNTHPQNDATNATIYNVALPFKGFSVTKPLPGAPGLIKIKCDAHEWMHAWIMELDHPYYATTDAEGHFVLKDVPPGTYTLVAWHEAAGETSTAVTVAAGQSAKPKLTLAVK
jgi:hypothetical protein